VSSVLGADRGQGHMESTRRDLLKMGGLGVLGAAGASVLPWGSGVGARSASELAEARLRPFRTRFVRPSVARAHKSVRDRDGRWVDHYELVMRPGRGEVLAGVSTPLFGYDGQVPGPTIKVRRGRRSVVRFRNHLPAVNPLSGQEFTKGSWGRLRRDG
jgi:spore coat protein A, manganese oxidase